MKRIIALLIYVFVSCVIIAQVQTYVQKGIVRSQSFVNKNGTRIVGAIIMRSGNNVDPVISLKTPEKGYFELSMENLDKPKVYYIKSVKGPKGTQYKVLYPQPNEILEFTPNAPLTIVMQSNRELDEYASYVKSKAIEEARKRFIKEKDSLELECQRGHINEIKKDSFIAVLQSKLDNYNEIIYDYIRKDLQEKDFESLDARQQEICIAMETGDYARLDSLLNWRSNEERKADFLKSQEEADLANQYAATKNKKYERVVQNIIFEKDAMIQSALGQLDFVKALNEMEDRLFYDSTNVNYLCQIGELLEIRFNDYYKARLYYQKALFNATDLRKTNKNIIAICHNHLGDVYNSLSEYALAEEHYTQACQFWESQKDEVIKDIFDSYLGLGKIYYSQARFTEAIVCFRKCINPTVNFVNKKAYWQGRLGIGQVKYIKGDYHGARAEFSAVLEEIASIQDVDIATLNMAYNSMIECMATIGQYQKAIDYCDTAIKIIKKHSSHRNTYIASLLINKGGAYINVGRIREGSQCMNEAIEIFKNILGESHPNYASACVQFADYYNLIGELNKSEEMSNKALELLNLKFGKNHLTTVAAHLSKCQLYQKYAKFGKAQAELDTIRTIYKSSGLLNDYNRIQISSCEATMKIAQGEQPEGIKVFQEAISCVIKTLGKESVQLIGFYNHIAMGYLEQIENEKAKTFLDKAQSLANKIYGSDNPIAIMQQNGMGQYYINRGEYHKAYELYSEIEKSAVETFGADNHQLCLIYNMLGDYHLRQYQFDKAKYYYEKLYEIVKATYGDEHYFIAEPITKIGAYCMQTGDFYRGLEKEQIAYSILSNHFGIGHKATLQSQLGICSAYIQLGKFGQAESILTELSKAVEKKLGKSHWTYSSILQIRATLHKSKGEFGKAIKCIEEAITIIEGIYGQHHSNTQQLYQQLGILYSDLCDFPKAIEYNDLAITIATGYYGKNNIGVMPLLLGKGQLYNNLNRIKEAHTIYDKVKNAYISNFGDTCKQLTSVYISETQLLLAEGLGEQAVEILEKVKEQMVAIYGENSVKMCEVYNSLADAYLCVMQYKKARSYYQKSLDIIKNSLGEYNVYCIKPLVGIGNICISEDVTGQQIEEASRLFRKAEFISSSVYGSNNANTASIDALLGQIYLRQGKLQDAYGKFQKYDTNVRQALGKNANTHTRTADVHMNMGCYYTAKANEAMFRQDSINTQDYASRAMEEFENAKSIMETIYGKDNAGITNSLNAIAQTYFILQHPDSAIATYIKAAELTIKQFGKHSQLAAQAHATLGGAYKYESDQVFGGDKDKLNAAKESFIQAILIRENTDGISKESLMISTMGWRMSLSDIYMKLNDYDNAFRMIDKIIYELEELRLDNKYGLYNCYYTKASMIVESARDTEEALDLLLKAKELISQLNFPNNLMKEMQQFKLMFAFGTVFEKTGTTNEAIKSYESAYEKLRVFPYNSQTDTMKQALRDKIKELKSK